MNPSLPESKDVSDGASGGCQVKRRVKWRRWLALLVVAGAVVWFVFGRAETPQKRLKRGIDRILSPVRKQERVGSKLYALADAMHGWPQPFPKLAAWC